MSQVATPPSPSTVAPPVTVVVPPLARAESVLPLTKSAGASRLVVFDSFRVVASFAVIWVHVCYKLGSLWGHDPSMLARFGTPFFAISGVFFAMGAPVRRPERSFWTYVHSRTTRLYWPFLGWSAIYLAMEWAEVRFLHHQRSVIFNASVLWNGGSYHLWFLPYILIASFFVFLLSRWLMRHPDAWRMVVILAVGLAVANAFGTPPAPLDPFQDHKAGDPIYFLNMVWLQSPALLMGVALATWYQFGGGKRIGGRGWAAGGAALFVVANTLVFVLDDSLLLRGLAGIGAAIFCLSVRSWSPPPWVLKLSRLGFGIYLIHLMVVHAVHMAGASLHLGTSAALVVPYSLLVFVICAALARGLLAVPGLRWLVP